jgi:two-component system copper resistance phosphate regulon response regulator CusR
MRALIIEDEEKLAGILSRGLKAEGFAVDIAGDGERGLQMTAAHSYDVIILDIMLPRLTGTQVLAAIREKNNHVPILMLTARDTVGDKVKHIGMGADDYLTKPFAFSELLVRVRALLRRAPAQRNDMLAVADLEVDRLSRQVRRAGKRIELSVKEYALLEYLVLNAGRVLSRNMIIEHVWDESFEGLTNIVDVYIRQLRSKIDEGFDAKLIKTMRGAGYILSDEASA